MAHEPAPRSKGWLCKLLNGLVSGLVALLKSESKLYQTELMLSTTNQITLTKQNTGVSYLPTVHLALYLDGESTHQFLPFTTRGTVKGWTTLVYAVPEKLAGHKLSAVGVHLIYNSGFVQPIGLALGQLKIIGHYADRPDSDGAGFPPAETFSWKNTYDERSSYRVYGLLAGVAYLLERLQKIISGKRTARRLFRGRS